MKINALTIIIGSLLLIVFGSLVFFYQVGQTQIAMVTTFGKPTGDEIQPGLKMKWPWPIQKVQIFDNRIQDFEEKLEQTQTRDGQNLLIRVFVGWKIAKPTVFRERFAGSVSSAQDALERIVRTQKDAVVGRHTFSNFISTDPKQLQFTEMEKEIFDAVTPLAAENGIKLEILGIKKIGLPESITSKVLDRMKEERTRYSRKLLAEGESEAQKIRSSANAESEIIQAQARAKASGLRGQADAEASKSLTILNQNPELADFLM
ncbi:MAG: hflC 3, partial [Verrucomicrobiales bacterium]|nr:hflC 3 [Verrucomicrobiales bacterium]